MTWSASGVPLILALWTQAKVFGEHVACLLAGARPAGPSDLTLTLALGGPESSGGFLLLDGHFSGPNFPELDNDRYSARHTSGRPFL